MQHKIIALALAAVASSAAFAQSNVQIYGAVDYGYTFRHLPMKMDLTTNDPPDFKYLSSSTNHRINSGQNIGNRLGFKGVENLGNGLKTVFVLERGFYLDTGADAGGFNRQAYVGLASDYGTVVGGRIYTPYYNLVSSLDPFGDGTVGQFSNVKGGFSSEADDIEFISSTNTLFNPVRVNNALAYISPNWGGLGFVAAYSNNALTDDSAQKGGVNDTVATVAANYTLDNAMVGLSFHRIKGGYDNQSANIIPLRSGLNVKNLDNITLGGSYDLQSVKLSAFWSWDNLKFAEPDLAFGNSIKQNTFMLGATVPLGKHAVKASVNYSKVKTQPIDHGKAMQFALGYDYNFSKRTAFYAAYAFIKNDKVQFDANGIETRSGRYAVTGDASNSGGDYRGAFQVGVKHTF